MVPLNLPNFLTVVRILLVPVLLATSRNRPDAVSLALAVVWLHFAPNGRRYAPIWVLVTVPTLARLAAGLPVVERITAWFAEAAPVAAPQRRVDLRPRPAPQPAGA